MIVPHHPRQWEYEKNRRVDWVGLEKAQDYDRISFETKKDRQSGTGSKLGRLKQTYGPSILSS